MVQLSSGVISSHIERGCLPPQNRAVFRVVATKPILPDGGCKYRFVECLVVSIGKILENIMLIITRLAISDGIDTYKHGLILVENPNDLPKKDDIIDLGYRSPGARFENKVEEGQGRKEIKIYVIHNFKIMSENGDGESGPSTPGPTNRENVNSQQSPMGSTNGKRPCPEPSTPSSSSSADRSTPTPDRYCYIMFSFTITSN